MITVIESAYEGLISTWDYVLNHIHRWFHVFLLIVIAEALLKALFPYFAEVVRHQIIAGILVLWLIATWIYQSIAIYKKHTLMPAKQKRSDSESHRRLMLTQDGELIDYETDREVLDMSVTNNEKKK